MGKPFSSELKFLPASLKWAGEIDVSPIAKFFSQAHGHVLVAVGAGGSFTTVELARLLHEERGGTALAHTPLSFIQSKSDLRDAYVVIFSASGNNRDVLATYEAAVQREPQGILIICGRKGSKIEKKAIGCERTVVFAERLPAGKDGYLATNSLAAFCALTIRAFGHPAPKPDEIIEKGETAPRRWAALELPPGDSYYLALFGGWGRPAATDFESKLSEAGLGGVMLADYRHFAHGRHNWLDKRGENTTVVAFLTPDSLTLARKTLALLPKSIRVITIESQNDGPTGAIALLMEVFRLTAVIGKRVGIDPGRPGVPGYGRKIYHLGPAPGGRPDKAGLEEPAVERKLAARGTSASRDDAAIVREAAESYVTRMARVSFGALVLDFDGTVVHPAAKQGTKLAPKVVTFLHGLLRKNVPVYFATGRGDSIHQILSDSLDAKLHSRVTVAYYNGAVMRSLAEAPPQPAGGPHSAEFAELAERLLSDSFIRQVARPENKSYQLTLRIASLAEYPAVSAAVRELVAKTPGHLFRVVQSSHSVDVIHATTTKLSGVRLAQARLEGGGEVLTIGDKGSLFGNDFDLLTHGYSLSVDSVSADLQSCWNLLPAGCRNVAGLLRYATWMRPKDGCFGLSFR